MRRLVFAAAVIAAVALPASPASAHGGGGSDATNFKSTVLAKAHPELRWEVIAGDALLELANESGREVVIEGYSGEPYLRFAADGGVFENRRSGAVYLNQDRYAEVDLPSDIDPKAPPEWRRVADGRTHAWHDHRIHWMAREKPPAAKASPGEIVEVQRWAVPYAIAGADGEVSGVLRYVPPAPWWPWVLAALAALAAPALLAARLARGTLTPRRLARTGAAVVGLLVALDAVHVWDDLVAVPATASENIQAGFSAGVFLVVALVSAAASWRASESAFALVFAGLALLFGFGLSHLGQLSASQVATVLPEWFTRMVVAANIGVIAPVAILVHAGDQASARVNQPGGAAA